MHSVNFSNKAVEDLSNIWNYSAKDGLLDRPTTIITLLLYIVNQ